MKNQPLAHLSLVPCSFTLLAGVLFNPVLAGSSPPTSADSLLSSSPEIDAGLLAGAGSGRHGELLVRSGRVLVIDTGSETFRGVPVTRGVFEFSSLHIEQGARLRFRGGHVPQLLVAGDAVIDGVIDVSGASPGFFPSLPCDVGVSDSGSPFFCNDATAGDASLDVTAEEALGQAGGVGGPGGARGGSGGDLAPIDPSFFDLGGLNSPGVFFDTYGQPGNGVSAGGTVQGAGDGGVAWPAVFPAHADDLGAAYMGQPGAELGVFDCMLREAGGNGAGGGSALPGSPAMDAPFGFGFFNGMNADPTALGGDAVLLDIDSFDPDTQRLNPAHLVGGAGGGGGGGGIGETKTNGFPLNCIDDTMSPILIDLIQARGAAGGGGGGAIRIRVGRSLTINGLIDASGGAGGGSGFSDSNFSQRLNNAASGGGGGGGTVLLQAPTVVVNGLVDVSGGEGGQGSAGPSQGGSGGAGRIQIYSDASGLLSQGDIAQFLVPSYAEILEVAGPAGLAAVVLPSQVLTAGEGSVRTRTAR